MVPSGLALIGLGSDLCNIERIANSIDRFGERFINRIFTDIEQAKANRRELTRAATFAKRFAAKEAVAKAFGTGLGAAMTFQEIEVINEASGRPRVVLHGTAAATAADRGMLEIHLSLSHTASHAMACAVVIGA